MLTMLIDGDQGADLLVDYWEGLVGFTVLVTNIDKSFDFSMSRNEWSILKKFIDDQIERKEDATE